MNKKNLGQFYTTNYKYILDKLYIPVNVKNIIEPFSGKGDLIKFINKSSDKKYNIEEYDIDPHTDESIQRDTLLDPPNYENKFIITNPPYLARNKSINKEIYNKYNQNDLYKCFIMSIISNSCIGGIIIIPVNFWCSIRKNDIELRRLFLEKYHIIRINIFEEKVFTDTSYSVCSFQFKKKIDDSINNINAVIYPIKKKINFILDKTTNFIIGGEIYNLNSKNYKEKYKLERLTKKNKDNKNKTNILIKCIDDNINNKIIAKIVDEKNIYIDNTPKLSARSYISIIINPYINIEKQKILVSNFNKYLNNKREKYNSLFLTNYRESNSIARKRISFKLVFEIIYYLLNSEIK